MKEDVKNSWVSLSKGFRRQIERTAKRGPRPEEMPIFQKIERERKQREEAAREAHALAIYELGIA